jgi:hypothetical protein
MLLHTCNMPACHSTHPCLMTGALWIVSLSHQVLQGRALPPWVGPCVLTGGEPWALLTPLTPLMSLREADPGTRGGLALEVHHHL